jgi:hypothetical protein
MRHAFASFALCGALCAQLPVTISPVDAGSKLGNSNNNYPFSQAAVAYQQVHSGFSFTTPGPLNVNQLRLRMGAGFTNRPGYPIDIEIFMAHSPNDAASASGTFANNVVAGSEVNVLTRKNVSLPTVPDNSWAIAPFFFDAPFAWNGGHLSWRVVIRGNGNGNQNFSYPIDAFWGIGQSSRIGTTPGCQSALGTRPPIHFTTIFEPGNTATFTGYSYVTSGGLPSVLTLGTSDSNWLGLTLPFDLGVIGAPLCFVTNDILATRNNTTQAGTNGAVTDSFAIPDDPTLAGATFFSQHMFLQVGANQLGLFTTDGRRNIVGKPVDVSRIFALGNPNATGGFLDPQFGLAIGFN